jgi:hypothetical protein
VTACFTIESHWKIIFHARNRCKRNIVGIEKSSLFVLAATITTVMVTPVQQLKTITFVMPWSTTISVVSAVTRISSKTILISTVLPAIMKKFILTISGIVTYHNTISALFPELITKECNILMVTIFVMFIRLYV